MSRAAGIPYKQAYEDCPTGPWSCHLETKTQSVHYNKHLRGNFYHTMHLKGTFKKDNITSQHQSESHFFSVPVRKAILHCLMLLKDNFVLCQASERR